MKNQQAPWGEILMYENPNDELYFGQVYRQVLQEAWLPEKAEQWARVGKSMRGRRPTQMGIYARSPTEEQSNIRLGFSKCAAAWKDLPWPTPNLPGCDDRWGKEYWKKEKDDRGVPCSYYDLFMRYCLRYWLDNQCIMPSAYTLDCGPNLTDVVCKGEYPLPITDPCGPLSLVAGEGQFSSPNIWTAPGCATEGILYFEDENGATGCLNYAFDPAYYCDGLLWPDSNPDEIAPNTSETITVQLGAPPYHWIVAGTDFSLASSDTDGNTNTLIAGPNACGTAVILVTDHCDFHVTGHVRSTEGVWTFICAGDNTASTCASRITYERYPDPSTKLLLGVGCHWHPFNCIFYTCGGYTSYIPPGAKCFNVSGQDLDINCGLQDSVCVHANVHLWVYKWEC